MIQFIPIILHSSALSPHLRHLITGSTQFGPSDKYRTLSCRQAFLSRSKSRLFLFRNATATAPNHQPHSLILVRSRQLISLVTANLRSTTSRGVIIFVRCANCVSIKELSCMDTLKHHKSLALVIPLLSES